VAQKISKEMIDARADELRALCERIGTLNDADRIVAEARVAQRKAEELQAMTIVHSQQLQEEWAAQVPHEEPVQLIKVKLTEEQRKAVHAQTGVWAATSTPSSCPTSTPSS
jgi:ribosome-associated toxin RatA of RatAB toxin-antitoxin module